MDMKCSTCRHYSADADTKCSIYGGFRLSVGDECPLYSVKDSDADSVAEAPVLTDVGHDSVTIPISELPAGTVHNDVYLVSVSKRLAESRIATVSESTLEKGVVFDTIIEDEEGTYYYTFNALRAEYIYRKLLLSEYLELDEEIDALRRKQQIIKGKELELIEHKLSRLQ